MAQPRGFIFEPAAPEPSSMFRVATLMPDRELKSIALRLELADVHLVTVSDYEDMSEEALMAVMKASRVSPKGRNRFLDQLRHSPIRLI